MRYMVKFVGDHQLPEETPWVFARCRDGAYLLMKESAVSAAALSCAWEVWQQTLVRAFAA